MNKGISITDVDFMALAPGYCTLTLNLNSSIFEELKYIIESSKELKQLISEEIKPKTIIYDTVF